MAQVELFAGLLSAVVLFALAAQRLRGVQPPVALVVGGAVVGALPFAPDVRLEPELVFLAFLPPILYPSAFRFAAEDVRSNLQPIGLLAVGLVLATMAGIAAALHLVAGVPWAAAFAIGAVLASTDPVAATAVIRSSGAPDRLATILEGESLVNDGTALTALRIAVTAVGGSFALAAAAGQFALIALGGAAIGAALGWAVSHLRARLDDAELESAIAALLAYGSFILAEQAGVSGILATVLAGWTMGRRSGDVVSAETRLRGTSFWSVTQFLAESILFLLVGIQFGQVLDQPAARSVPELIGMTALVVAVAVAVRVAWMFTVPYLVGTMSSARERLIIGAAGLRGAVSVAAALSLPLVVDGERFPDRESLIVVALGAIVALLVAPALVIGPLLDALGLAGSDEAAERERAARAELATAALRCADAIAERDAFPGELMARLREPYEWRISFLRGEEAAAHRSPAFRELRRELVAAQRRRLAELASAGEVHGAVLRALEADLDLEEARIR